MSLRPAHSALALLVCGLLALLLSFADAAYRRAHHAVELGATRQLAASLGLTDLCLFTEARYTRHPSQADLNSAFQDHPLALEHFPSGSLLPPPRTVIAPYENLDRQTDRPD